MAPEINSLSSESNVFHHLYEQARLLYNFASRMTTHSNHKNCSELAPTLTMTEVHLLVDIMEQPGIGVSELGRLNLKTRGAISQMVKKLEQAGMITKSVNEQHARILDLHLTPLGLAIAREHAEFDVKALTNTLNQLLDKCSMEEIDHYYKVLQCYNDILKQSNNE